MKSLFESLTVANESANSGSEGIVAAIKELFSYDKLERVQKEIVADMFREYHGVIWDQLDTFQENMKTTDLKKAMKEGKDLCKEIYTALKP